jgi:ribosomal protein S21
VQIVERKPVWFNQPTMRSTPLEVTVREQSPEGIDRALNQLKKVLDKEELFQQLKDREYFKSKSRKKYEARKQLIYKLKLKKEKVFDVPRRLRREYTK